MNRSILSKSTRFIFVIAFASFVYFYSSLQVGIAVSIFLFSVWYVGELLLESRSTSFATNINDKSSRKVMVWARDLSLMAPILVSMRVEQSSEHLWLCAGVFLACLGIVIRIWAIITLGQFFTMTLNFQVEQSLVTSGPYKYIRHPGYLGLLLIYPSFSLITGQYFLFPFIMLATYFAVRYRIQLEENMLIERMGETYRRYARTTPGLLPLARLMVR